MDSKVPYANHASTGSLDQDQIELAAFGKKQVLKRTLGFWSGMGIALTCTVTWEGVLILFAYGLTDGGPAGLIYEYIYVWIGFLATMASIAELSSMVPTAAGQYQWTHLLAPPRWKKFASYVTGWQTVIAWNGLFTSAAYLSGTIIQGLIVLNYPDYDYKRWHGTLLVYAITLLVTTINVISPKLLALFENVILILHLTAFVGILVALVVLAPHSNASDVFLPFQENGGYASQGTTFMVGTTGLVFAFLGADGTVHMSEEIPNATTVVPWTIILSILVNGCLGFGMTIAILFCIGDIPTALSTPTGFPFLEIFTHAVGSIGGGTALSAVVVVLPILGTASMLAAASRMTWSFARDNGLPGSSYIGHVNSRTSLPLWAIAVPATTALLLSLINIGSSTVLNAFLSLVTAGFLGSYFIPITLLVYRRITSPATIRFGPWRLGVFGLPINIFSLVFCFLTLVFSFFPLTVPVTAVTMNWSCVLYGGANIFAVVFYFVTGRKQYDGPIRETDVGQQSEGFKSEQSS